MIADAWRGVRSRWDVVLVVALGGALGSLVRWWLETLWPARPGGMPWATLVINVTGCGLLGALLVLVLEVWPPSRYVRPLLGTGVLGGYTTFSTAMAETRALLADGAPVVAASYVLVSLLAGLAAVWLAAAGTRGLVRLRRRMMGDDDEVSPT